MEKSGNIFIAFKILITVAKRRNCFLKDNWYFKTRKCELLSKTGNI